MATGKIPNNSIVTVGALAIGAAASILAVSDVRGQAVASGSADAGALTEIVVTAERRSTNLQVTPVAATVLSGDALQNRGVNSVDQLQFTTPSLTVNDFGQGVTFNIRGIGKGENNVQTPSGVVTYRDGVPLISTFLQNEPYYDIGSIEVLRGPQGTFSGVNATGGAVYITEKNPDFTGVHGYGELQYGNYNDRMWQGAINLPLSDTFAARIAYNGERRQTFYNLFGPHDHDLGILDSNNVRVSLLWQPTDTLKILVKTDYNDINNGGYQAVPYTIGGNLFNNYSDANAAAFDEFTRSVIDISYTFTNGDVLRSISGYQRGRAGQNIDLDGTTRAFATSSTFQDYGKFQDFSEELNLLSPDTGFFRWILGAFFSREVDQLPPGNGFNINVDLTTPAPAPLVPFLNINLVYETPKKHEGVFAQAKFELSPAWELQVGARYNHSSFDLTDNQTTNVLFPPPPLALPLPNVQSQSDSKLTGKVDLSYALDTNNYLFAFVATGHKDGGLNTNFGEPVEIQPENLTDYEVGWKSTLMDHHLRTQTGVFYTTYKDFQVSLPDPATGTAPILNAPKATIWGFEAQAQAEFSNFSFDASAAYIHARFGNFFAIDSRSFAAPYPTCDLAGGPGSAECSNLSGHTIPNSPTWTANAGVQYTIPLASQQSLTPRLDYAYVGSQWATVFANNAFADQYGSRSLLNALLSYDVSKLDLALYATNLANRQYVSSQYTGLPVPVQLAPGLPRQFGIRAIYRF